MTTVVDDCSIIKDPRLLLSTEILLRYSTATTILFNIIVTHTAYVCIEPLSLKSNSKTVKVKGRREFAPRCAIAKVNGRTG